MLLTCVDQHLHGQFNVFICVDRHQHGQVDVSYLFTSTSVRTSLSLCTCISQHQHGQHSVSLTCVD